MKGKKIHKFFFFFLRVNKNETKGMHVFVFYFLPQIFSYSSKDILKRILLPVSVQKDGSLMP